MKGSRIGCFGIPLALLLFGAGAPALAADALAAHLIGFQEVPPISTTGEGRFLARMAGGGHSLEFELTYERLTGTAMVAHVHFGQRSVSGGVVAFLCGGGGKPACPPSGTVKGTLTAADVIGPEGQGISPGQVEEFLRAVAHGLAYVNVHTDLFPNGEIRGQIRRLEASAVRGEDVSR